MIQKLIFLTCCGLVTVCHAVCHAEKQLHARHDNDGTNDDTTMGDENDPATMGDENDPAPASKERMLLATLNTRRRSLPMA